MAALFLEMIMNTPGKGPDDTRRKRLLNFLLLGVFGSAVLTLLVTGVGLVFKFWKFADAALLIITCLAFIFGNLAIYYINRKSGPTAAVLFLVLLLAAFAFSDSPDQVSGGRSLFFAAIPIAIASLLILPAASFIFAFLSTVIITILAFSINSYPNIPAIVGFFVLALVSWLSARSLEQALKELRSININLDHLVQERTQELANSLKREQIEAGRSKAILESIADGVIVFDVTGSAISANPSSMRLLDLSHDNVVGATIEELSQAKPLNAESRSVLTGLLTSPGAHTTSNHIEWDKKTLSVTSAPVNDTLGANIGTVAVFRDYTHEAEVERMKDTFLAIVSHELRTPLNAILGYAEMIKEAIYGPVNEKQIRASDRIMTNSRRLLDIVSDLLDQGRMEAGKLALHVRPFRPADLIENVHGVMDKIAADKSLALTSELDPGLAAFISGDIARLQQILVNLINNSVKFTEKGSVHVYLRGNDEHTWSMEVRDTGIGIPEAEIPTIFEAFRQVDSTATRKYGGFGLGLSIVKQLTELMEGHIVVTSTLGEGSCFIVTLPLVQAE
jgi:PAS domain S-box-containing protein